MGTCAIRSSTPPPSFRGKNLRLSLTATTFIFSFSRCSLFFLLSPCSLLLLAHSSSAVDWALQCQSRLCWYNPIPPSTHSFPSFGPDPSYLYIFEHHSVLFLFTFHSLIFRSSWCVGITSICIYTYMQLACMVQHALRARVWVGGCSTCTLFSATYSMYLFSFDNVWPLSMQLDRTGSANNVNHFLTFLSAYLFFDSVPPLWTLHGSLRVR